MTTQTNANESQNILREMLRRLLADPGERGGGQADSSVLWRKLRDDLGLLAAPLTEERGGLGGGFADAALIAEELGRGLAPVPFAAASVLAGGLFDALGRTGLNDDIVAGAMLPVPAWLEADRGYSRQPHDARLFSDGDGLRLSGGKVLVEDIDLATHLLVTAAHAGGEDPALLLLARQTPGIVEQRYRLLDGRNAANLRFEDVAIEPGHILAQGQRAVLLFDQALDRAAVASCAEGVGTMRAMLDQTVAYVRERRQFGKAIASFQAIQHRLADMLIEIEQSASVTLMAIGALEDPVAVSTAKARTAKALRHVSQNAVQLHGGIGTTDELPLSRYFKRAMLLERQFGSAEHHLARIERLRPPASSAA